MHSLATPVSAAAAQPSGRQRFPLHLESKELRGIRLRGCLSPEMTKKHGGLQSKRTLSNIRAMDMSASESDDSQKLFLDTAIDSLRDFWGRGPLPIRSFPWMRASRHFLDLIFDLIVSVIKYLCIPVLTVSSLSEISYCAHERKMFAIPLPFLCGIAIARVLDDCILEISPAFKDMEIPWHLMLMAGFFMLVKLPGPYYPYFCRLVLPHFANGGLCFTIWSVFSWFRRSHPQATEK